jgi:hypothetical protein
MAKVPARPGRHVVGLDPVFQHDSWVGDELATQAGLDIHLASPGIFGTPPSSLYPLERVMGVVKFGPHRVVVKTPLSNIRINNVLRG